MSDNKNFSFSDKWAFTLLGLATIVILIIIFVLCTSRFIFHPTPQKVKIEWALAPKDSLMSNNFAVSPALLDSVKSILTLHEQRVNEKIEHIIEKREQEEDAKTAVAIICGFCISIFAFFGYKSFKDIKKEAVDIAQNTSAAKAVEVIQQNLPREIDDKFRVIYAETMRQTIRKEILDQIPTTLKNQIVEYLESLSVDGISNEPRNNPENFFNE